MIIGAIVVLRWSVPLFVSDQPTREIPSPGGAMKAVVVVRAGGGGLSPYCTSSVHVMPRGRTTPSPEFEVFFGDCVTLEGFDEKVAWRSDSNLRIGVSSLLGTMTFRRSDKSGQVRVDFDLDR